MEQLDESDGNEHGRNTNINHFSLLFESDDEEGNNLRTKPNKTPVIVLSEYEDEDKNKGEKKNDDEKYNDNREKYNMERTKNFDIDDELNWDFGSAEIHDNSDNDEKEHIPW